jgi:hypothetical protein
VAGEVTGSFDISVVIGLLDVKADAGMATALGPDSYGPVIVIAICVMLVDTLVIGRGVTVVHEESFQERSFQEESFQERSFQEELRSRGLSM